MLVISRRENEEIVVRVPNYPHPIVVRIADIRGNKVRISIEAPKDVTIDRREVDLRKHPPAPVPT